jgi:hypothetical protein
MTLPNFTAESSLGKKPNLDHYSLIHAGGGNTRMEKSQVLSSQHLPHELAPEPPDGGGCRPRCGPCIKGVKVCTTSDCDEIARPCCSPSCGACINFTRECKRSDCSVYYQSCCPCEPMEWCEYFTLVRRNCDCSETREADSPLCALGPL